MLRLLILLTLATQGFAVDSFTFEIDGMNNKAAAIADLPFMPEP